MTPAARNQNNHSAVIDRRYSGCDCAFSFRGRRTNSPPQFGQT
jgi:hypothetical protein